MVKSEDVGICDFCGHRLDVEGDDVWLALEVFRPEADYVNVAFCGQAHAAEWLTMPLPPVEPLSPQPTTMKERLIDWAVASLFLATACLAVIGAYTVVRLLGGWG